MGCAACLVANAADPMLLLLIVVMDRVGGRHPGIHEEGVSTAARNGRGQDGASQVNRGQKLALLS